MHAKSPALSVPHKSHRRPPSGSKSRLLVPPHNYLVFIFSNEIITIIMISSIVAIAVIAGSAFSVSAQSCVLLAS